MAFQAQGREHQLFAIRVCFRFHPAAGSWFRALLLAPIPCLLRFHPSPPARVCGFLERGRGSGASAASMADAVPALTAPWPAAGGRLPGRLGPSCPRCEGRSRLRGWRGLLCFGGMAEPSLGSSKQSAAGPRRPWCQQGWSRAEGEMLRMARPAGTEGLPRRQHPQRGDAASRKHEPGSQPKPLQPAPLTGQTDGRTRHRLPRCLQGLAGPQPGGHRSRGGKVTLAAPGWPRVPVGGLCPGCRTRLCRSLLLAAACCLANAAEHRTAPHRCRHVPARCWSLSRGWGGPGPP